MRTQRKVTATILCLLWMVLTACTASGLEGGPTQPAAGVEPSNAPTEPAPICAETLPTPPPASGNGIIVYGCVSESDGSGVAGAKLYRAYASYPGELIAVSGLDGSYQSEFMPIPGDEMVRVWAEMEGKAFGPVSQIEWVDGVYYWRHYAGYEASRLDFKVNR